MALSRTGRCFGFAGNRLDTPWRCRGLQIAGVTFDAHTLLFSSLAILMGYQSILFAIFAKTFAISEGFLPKDPRVDRFFKIIYLERGLALGTVAFLAGLILLGSRRVAVEIYPFRPSRLRRHHALGHSGRDPDGVGLSNRALKFFCKYSGNEASPMSHASTALKSESDAFASLRMTISRVNAPASSLAENL